MKKAILMFALALAGGCALAELTTDTQFQDIPGTATVGEIVEAGGGGGGGGGITPQEAERISGRVTSNVVTKAYVEGLGITGGSNTVQGAARPLPKYLHALDFADSYPDDAAWYYAMADIGGACSARRIGGSVERNFDFPFDERAEFVVRVSGNAGVRFASVGVAQVGTNLTENIVTSGKWSRYYKCLPGATVDGINERGVVAEINVIPTNGAERTAWPGHEINALGAVRWVLDHATDAGMAASNLAAKVYIPDALIRKGYSAHFMVADENSTWVVEDGAAHPVGGVIPNAPQTGDTTVGGVIPNAPPAVMTNFRLFSADPYGTGYERYDLLASGGNITSAWFRAAYRRPFTRPTEFAAPGVGTHTATNALLAWAEANVPQGAPESLTRNGKSWQTIHTSVYDISNRTVRIAVQETDDWYTFAVPSAGGVDEGAVREIVEPMIESATNGNYMAMINYAAKKSGEATQDFNARNLTAQMLNVVVGHDGAIYRSDGIIVANDDTVKFIQLQWPDFPESDFALWTLATEEYADGLCEPLAKRVGTNETAISSLKGDVQQRIKSVDAIALMNAKLTEAKQYALTAASVTLDSATNYTDACCRTLAVSATNYTDAATNTTLAAANAYTDAATNALAATIPAPYAPDPADPAFSNAVVSVALPIGTNELAALRELGGIPLGEGAATVGGLLAALAAAVAWLKRKTADIETAVGTANADLETALNGEEA